jgi:uncharacterized protein (DUF2147 family)
VLIYLVIIIKTITEGKETMKNICGIVILLVLFLGVHSYAQNADSILGEWYTEEDRSLVEIYKCDNLYCGKIVWLKQPLDEKGKEKIDFKNPDETKRDRKLIGLTILSAFKHQESNEWAGGKIYDPKNGKTYSCKMILDSNKLKVRGFIGISLLGRTTVWTKKI